MDGKSFNQSPQDGSNTIYAHNDEKQYPPMKVVLPAMAAIYLALFLVAIVSLSESADFWQ